MFIYYSSVNLHNVHKQNLTIEIAENGICMFENFPDWMKKISLYFYC